MKNYSKAFTPTPKSLVRGFTLIEILIGITIFAIVALSLYSTFFSGTSVWKRSEDENRLYQEARWSLETIAKELRNAIMLDYQKIYPDFVIFEGSLESISFLNVTDEGIKKISYFIESENGDFLLKREETSLLDSLSSYEEERQSETFSSLVSEGGLRFSYAYANIENEQEISWQGAWQDTQILPKGVKLELILRNPRDPAMKTAFSKTIVIPLGVILEASKLEDEI